MLFPSKQFGNNLFLIQKLTTNPVTFIYHAFSVRFCKYIGVGVNVLYFYTVHCVVYLDSLYLLDFDIIIH